MKSGGNPFIIHDAQQQNLKYFPPITGRVRRGTFNTLHMEGTNPRECITELTVVKELSDKK